MSSVPNAIITRILPSTVLLLLLATGCAVQPDKTLYQSLGEREGIDAIIDNLVNEIGNDPILLDHFRESSIARFKTQLGDFVCLAANGPCAYEGDDMIATHAGMNITEAEFNRLVEAFIAAMNSAGTPAAAQNKLLAKLALYREQIIYR